MMHMERPDRRLIHFARPPARWIGCIVVIAALLASASGQQSQQPKAKPADAELLKELESDLLGDLPAASPSGKKKVPASQCPDRDQALRDELQGGEDLGSQPENPLLRISRQMRSVQERISQRDTSAATQTVQSEIVSELDKLIEQAKRQGVGGNRQSGGKGTGQAGVGDGQVTPRAGEDSTDRVGKPQTDVAQTTEVRSLLERIWGHLPEKTRDEMRNALSEQFLPKYERLIEEYYQRLAEERSAGP